MGGTCSARSTCLAPTPLQYPCSAASATQHTLCMLHRMLRIPHTFALPRAHVCTNVQCRLCEVAWPSRMLLLGSNDAGTRTHAPQPLPGSLCRKPLTLPAACQQLVPVPAHKELWLPLEQSWDAWHARMLGKCGDGQCATEAQCPCQSPCLLGTADVNAQRSELPHRSEEGKDAGADTTVQTRSASSHRPQPPSLLTNALHSNLATLCSSMCMCATAAVAAVHTEVGSRNAKGRLPPCYCHDSMAMQECRMCVHVAPASNGIPHFGRGRSACHQRRSSMCVTQHMRRRHPWSLLVGDHLGSDLRQ